MDALFTIASILFLISVVRNIFLWLWLWQAHEYRFDRLRFYLYRTTEGRNIWLSRLLLIKTIGIFLYIPTVFDEKLLYHYALFVIASFTFTTTVLLKEIFNGTVRVPLLTLRSSLLLLPTAVVILLFYNNPIIDRFLWLLLLDRFAFLCIALFLFASSFPSELYWDWQRTKIKKLRDTYKDLLVIGVVGNEGKDVAVHMLMQMLNIKKQVVATKGTQNGVLRFLNILRKKVDYKTQVLITEIGGYTKGEIQTHAEMLKPDIGVITAVDGEYGMYKSLQDNWNAQLEILSALPNDGLVFIEGKSFQTTKIFAQSLRRAMKQKKGQMLRPVIYTKDSVTAFDKYKGPEIRTRKIRLQKEALSFECIYQNESYQFHAPLLGETYITYLLPAIAISKHLGLERADIQSAVSLLTPLTRHMVPYRLQTGATAIDNTHPVVPSEVSATLQYMKLYKGKKIFIFAPMTNLSKSSADEHYLMAREIGNVCDIICVTNVQFRKHISQGITESGGRCIIKYGSTNSLASFIGKQLTKREDIALFSGETAESTLRELLKYFH